MGVRLVRVHSSLDDIYMKRRGGNRRKRLEKQEGGSVFQLFCPAVWYGVTTIVISCVTVHGALVSKVLCYQKMEYAIFAVACPATLVRAVRNKREEVIFVPRKRERTRKKKRWFHI